MLEVVVTPNNAYDGVMKRALIIPAQKSPYTIMVDDNAGDFIRSVVGGYFDCVREDKFIGYVNDTGLIDGLPINTVACILFGQVLCGDIIIFGALNAQGVYDGENHAVDPMVIQAAKYQHLLLMTHSEAGVHQ